MLIWQPEACIRLTVQGETRGVRAQKGSHLGMDLIRSSQSPPAACQLVEASAASWGAAVLTWARPPLATKCTANRRSANAAWSRADRVPAQKCARTPSLGRVCGARGKFEGRSQGHCPSPATRSAAPSADSMRRGAGRSAADGCFCVARSRLLVWPRGAWRCQHMRRSRAGAANEARRSVPARQRCWGLRGRTGGESAGARAPR